MRTGTSTTSALKLKKEVRTPPAHFKCGAMENALMKAEAGGYPRLKPELAHVTQQSYVFSDNLESSGQLPLDTHTDLQDCLTSALSDT